MTTFQVPTLAQMTAEGKAPEVLFWVGCAGSFDDRAKKITKAKRMIRSSEDNVELIKKLGELKKAGIISNKEFQTKKKQLLDKI